MSRLAAVSTALPPHRHAQDEITAAFAATVLGSHPEKREVLERLHAATGVRTRHLALPLADYATLDGFTAANDAFLRAGLDLAEQSVRAALTKAGLGPADVDVLMSVSVTGVAAPSLDARLVPRLGLREDVKRLPVFGLGCVAGAAGIARLHDYLVGHPDEVAVLVSVELCSLTFQRNDASMANFVGSGLFGDGSAAVVLVGEERASRHGLTSAPRVLTSRSRFYPDTERVMGWDVGGSGFRIVLAGSVADVVEANVGEDVRRFLEDADLKIEDVTGWVAHPGGPKVLHALQRCLGLPDGALDVSWECLAETGNLSSASVLNVLQQTLDDPVRRPAGPAVLMAMGPGFCAEMVLLEC